MKKNLVYKSVKWISSFFILLTGLNSTYKWSNNLWQYDVHHSFSPKLTWPDNFTDIGTCFPPFPNTLKIWKWIPLLDKLLIYAPYKFQSSLCWWLGFQAIYLHEAKSVQKSSRKKWKAQICRTQNKTLTRLQNLKSILEKQ